MDAWSHIYATQHESQCSGVFAGLNAGVHNFAMQYAAILQAMMSATGLKQAGIAKKLRVAQPTVSRWMKGQKPDTDQHQRIVAEATRLGIIHGNLEETSNPPLRTVEHETSASVPEFEVRGGASYAGGISEIEADTDEYGHAVSRDVVRARWGIPVPFLRDELRLNPGRVHILPVRGDSMNDALFDGDRAIIDLEDTDVSQGGIFAIRDDNGSVIIKQVELLRGAGKAHARIRCKSRNPHYEPFELILQDPVAIIGRVACKITRL